MMAIFCYRTKDNELIEREYPCGKAPARIKHNGGFAKRSYQDELGVRPVTAENWPMTCFASGVNTAQAGELRDFFKKNGVPTEVTRDGDPVYRSASHRKEALKVRGIFDKQSFY